MTKSHLFTKNNNANPVGRPKGKLSKSTIAWRKVRDEAVKDYKEAYDEIRLAMQQGEGWAHQIFYSKIVFKKAMEETISLNLPSKIEGETTDSYLRRFIEALGDFNEYTFDEVMLVIKALNKVKLTESITDGKENIFQYLEDDQIELVCSMIEESKKKQKDLLNNSK